MWKVAGRLENLALIFLAGLSSILEAALVVDQTSLPVVTAFPH